jgi:hypothetical protein
MRKWLLALPLLATALAAHAGDRIINSGRSQLGEVWVYPMMFQQALAPLAPLSAKAMREGLCPGMIPGKDDIIHAYEFDARFKMRGVENRRYEVTELRLVNPSSCPALDEKVTQLMRQAIPQFAEPRKDLDKNGWTRIPRIELRMTD